MRPRIFIRGCVYPSVRRSVCNQFAKKDRNHQTSLLDASSHLYKRLCLSVRPSVRPSVGQQLAKIDENHQASLLVGPVENAKQISEPITEIYENLLIETENRITEYRIPNRIFISIIHRIQNTNDRSIAKNIIK